MDKLLHQYEQELGRLRQATHLYAQDHPDTAKALEPGPHAGADPEMERLLQSVALLNATTMQLIEEGRCNIHKALLQTLQPHYLRTVPSCGIVQVDAPRSATNAVLPRGTVLQSATCKFLTAYDVKVAPVAITQVKFQAEIDMPAALTLPAKASSAIRITIETACNKPPHPKLRICIGSKPELVDALLLRSLCVCVEMEGRWHVLPENPFALAGFSQEESLLPAVGGNQVPRLLTEYSILPQKFDFLDLDLAALARYAPPGCTRLSLHVVLPNFLHTNDGAQIRKVGTHDFRLACTPVINLSKQTAQPIPIDGRMEAYPILPSRAGCEVYSIDKVSLTTGAGEQVLPAFHGINHLSEGPYWKLDDCDGCAIHLVDRAQNPVALESGTINAHLTCCDGDMARQPGALATEVGSYTFRFLRTPTSPFLFTELSRICQAIQSPDTSLPELKTLFMLHGLKVAEGLSGLVRKPVAAWFDYPAGRLHMNGSEYTILLDVQALNGQGIRILAEMLANLLAAKTFENRYIELCLANVSGEALYRTGALLGKRKSV